MPGRRASKAATSRQFQIPNIDSVSASYNRRAPIVVRQMRRLAKVAACGNRNDILRRSVHDDSAFVHGSGPLSTTSHVSGENRRAKEPRRLADAEMDRGNKPPSARSRPASSPCAKTNDPHGRLPKIQSEAGINCAGLSGLRPILVYRDRPRLASLC